MPVIAAVNYRATVITTINYRMIVWTIIRAVINRGIITTVIIWAVANTYM
jgi:hypothetical protein